MPNQRIKKKKKKKAMAKQQNVPNIKAVNHLSQQNVNILQEQDNPDTQQQGQDTQAKLHWSEVWQNFGGGFRDIAVALLILVPLALLVYFYFNGAIDEKTFSDVFITLASNFIQ
ncbi:hypothetical protein [Bacillus tropicus]|uniref:hypothetical protein n=1 Tax=Bacillus tropicus TaxID=2026188 RepID=UPI0013D2D492|nr:hypothetical protein [Bacillus tropicus]